MRQLGASSPQHAVGSPCADPASFQIAGTDWRDFAELCKPGIVRIVVFTAGVGFILASLGANWTLGSFLITAGACLLGTALSAAGANALNQAYEAARDAKMARTADRPVAAGRLSESQGKAIGVALSAAGVGVLLIGCGVVPASVSLVTILSYILLYTPMKPITPVATIVGAVPGALPPLIGWTAATIGPWHGLNEPGGWSMVLLMFVWQIPHFLAIAWKYRAEYARGGHRVLPALDPTGVRTGRAVVLWSIALLAVSFMPILAMRDIVGPIYFVVALIGGIAMLYASVRLAQRCTDKAAITLFVVSILYLPAVLLGMVADAVWRSAL